MSSPSGSKQAHVQDPQRNASPQPAQPMVDWTSEEMSEWARTEHNVEVRLVAIHPVVCFADKILLHVADMPNASSSEEEEWIVLVDSLDRKAETETLREHAHRYVQTQLHLDNRQESASLIKTFVTDDNSMLVAIVSIDASEQGLNDETVLGFGNWMTKAQVIEKYGRESSELQPWLLEWLEK